ncbi:MAG: hypothetical protein ACREFF_06920 [Candidatus Udaeobacter sp.]
MHPPDVENRFRDEKSDITYVVFAYRQLEGREIIDAIRYVLARCKKKDRPKRGQTFTIFTVLGAEYS